MNVDDLPNHQAEPLGIPLPASRWSVLRRRALGPARILDVESARRRRALAI